jgi:cadmium resistance protein CadD (predicted permease)
MTLQVASSMQMELSEHLLLDITQPLILGALLLMIMFQSAQLQLMTISIKLGQLFGQLLTLWLSLSITLGAVGLTQDFLQQGVMFGLTIYLKPAR